MLSLREYLDGEDNMAFETIVLKHIDNCLDEGTLRDLFPKIYSALGSRVFKEEYSQAVSEYIDAVDKGGVSSLHVAKKIAGIFRHVDTTKLAEIINNLVKTKDLSSTYRIS